jgi:dGTPase
VVHTTEKRIAKAGVQTANQARQYKEPLARYSAARQQQNLALREYLYTHLYYNPEVHEPNRRAVRLLRDLFEYYLAKPQELGMQARKRARKEGLHRSICDYLAGMTDRYAMQEHQRLFGVAM